jgi:hypothetical protein
MEASGQLHAPAAFFPEKEPRCPLDRKPDGPQSLFGRSDEDKKPPLPPPGIGSRNYTGSSILCVMFNFGLGAGRMCCISASIFI